MSNSAHSVAAKTPAVSRFCVAAGDAWHGVARARSALWQIGAALLFAVVLLYGVGFAAMDTLHNAAHDSRHSVAFPCH